MEFKVGDILSYHDSEKVNFLVRIDDMVGANEEYITRTVIESIGLSTIEPGFVSSYFYKEKFTLSPINTLLKNLSDSLNLLEIHLSHKNHSND